MWCGGVAINLRSKEVTKNLRLQNKVALITGASQGLGRAMALRFAEEGAAVAVNDVQNSKAAEEVCQAIIAGGGRAIFVRADVADFSQVELMVEETLKEFSKIDILVNNAGIIRPSPLLDISPKDLDRMIDINLKGPLHCVQAAGKNMIGNRYGRILNMASIAALGTTIPETTPYALTKAAVIILTKRMAFELGTYNISVNAIAPGFIKTPMTIQDEDSPETQKIIARLSKKSMLCRAGEPKDIAEAALFLVSDEASFITAQVLTVDGGRMDFLSHSA